MINESFCLSGKYMLQATSLPHSNTLDWPQHAGETLLLADSMIGAYCDTEYEFLSAGTKTDM